MLALVLLLVATCSARSSALNKIMLQIKATGSFGDVYELLLELQSLNLQEQQDADARNVTEEAACEQLLSTLNTAVSYDYDEENSDLDTVSEIQDAIEENNATVISDTQELSSNLALLDRLADQRCAGNEAYVEALIENNEGIEIIELLRRDVAQFILGQENTLLQTSQMLVAYSHLFTRDNTALTTLLQSLDDDLFNGIDAYAAKYNITIQPDPTYSYNASVVDQFDDYIESNLNKLLDKLEEILEENIDDLTSQELKTTRDYAKYRKGLLQENDELAEDINTRTANIAALTNQLKGALGAEATDEVTYQDDETTLAAASADCLQKRQYYASETARRQEEDLTIAEAIRLFQTEFPELSDYVKQHGDGNFTEAVPRRTSSFSFSRDDYQEAGGYTPL